MEFYVNFFKNQVDAFGRYGNKHNTAGQRKKRKLKSSFLREKVKKQTIVILRPLLTLCSMSYTTLTSLKLRKNFSALHVILWLDWAVTLFSNNFAFL